jgi:UDP-glucuronate 4-epimerase
VHIVVLVTGAAGFIGYHVARRLAERGETVVGIDNLNDYYDVELKRRRLEELAAFANFEFRRVELADPDGLPTALAGKRVGRVIHLAAQANVRYALENPRAYVASNVAGHLNVLEFCRHADGLEKLVYASSSSVYGTANEAPFREDDVTDRPSSLYAATKKADEMMSGVYSGLFGLPQIGLRFFSVYGPWGRPDMAYWLFAEAILAGRPIKAFAEGHMQRDFTYIDDAVTGVLAAADAPAAEGSHRIYNLGNSRPVAVIDMIAILERLLGRKATVELLPAQPGEAPFTCADVSAIHADLGFAPDTPLEEGLARFVDWFRWYRREAERTIRP